MEPKISIVIPCFNHAEYLHHSILSAIQQTVQPYEIIVIDDGSTDNTMAVATNFPAVKYFFQDNNGLSSARNTGLNKATGEFILFNDADDILAHTALEHHLRCYKQYPMCILVSGPNIRIDNSGAELPYKQIPAGPAKDDTYESLLTKNYIGMPGTALIKKDKLIAIGGYDETLDSCEDFDVYLKLARNQQFGFHSNICGYYRTSTNSMSTNGIRMLNRSVEVFKRQNNFVTNNKKYAHAYKAGLKSNVLLYCKQIATHAAVALYQRDMATFSSHTKFLFQYSPLVAIKSFASVFRKIVASLARKAVASRS